MTDFTTLPNDVKREFVYMSMTTTIAVRALSKQTNDTPIEFWMGQIASLAYRDVQKMSDADIEKVIKEIEHQRRTGYGVIRLNLDED